MKPIIFSLCLAFLAIGYSPVAKADALQMQSFEAVKAANPMGLDGLNGPVTLDLAPSATLNTLPTEPLGEGHQTAMVIIAAGGLLLSAIALFSSMN